MPNSSAEPSSESILNRVVAAADQRFVRVLRREQWSRSDIVQVVSFWTSKARPEETLTNFLQRNGILAAGATRVLAASCSEQLIGGNVEVLFNKDGLAKLRQLLIRPLCVPMDGAKSKNDVVDDSHEADDTATSMPEQQTPVVRKAQPISSEVEPKPSSPKSSELLSGQILGRCLITGRIASGSYGVVYRALHRTLNIPVAVKVLHPDLLGPDSSIARQFHSEAMILARITHPNIVRLWDYDDSVAPPYLVLEFVEGHNVAELIGRRGALPANLCLKIISQVADGLSAAHHMGIVHRDIKPGNILVARDEKAKIADLGLATVVDRNRHLNHTSEAPQSLAGTVAYLAPEQVGSRELADHRSDIYALGATFFHMLTGRMPFEGTTSLEVLMQHAESPVTPPNKINNRINARLSDIVVRMMAKSPSDRFGNYDDLRDALLFADASV
jgi:hypothetical protein